MLRPLIDDKSLNRVDFRLLRCPACGIQFVLILVRLSRLSKPKSDFGLPVKPHHPKKGFSVIPTRLSLLQPEPWADLVVVKRRRV